jgi:N-dimethylarginine dimethylaminohydrolase
LQCDRVDYFKKLLIMTEDSIIRKPDFYMCAPTYFDIIYSINCWMIPENKPNKILATQQWHALVNTLKTHGAEIEFVPPQNLPDFVYIADSGIIYKNHFLCSNFFSPERKKESPFWKNFFSSRNYNVTHLSEHHSYEGSGDSFIIYDRFFCGYGFRTKETAVYEAAEILDLVPESLQLIDERFYHLDTCFSPLNSEAIIFYPKAFTSQSRKKLENNFNCYAITEKEALLFACNIVSFNNKIIASCEYGKTTQLLEKHGFEVKTIDLSEFIKAGGAAKCLTLKSHHIT